MAGATLPDATLAVDTPDVATRALNGPAQDAAAAPITPAKTQRRQMTNVIVTLRIASTANEASDIAAAQDRVLRALSGHRAQVVRRYDAFPMLALAVDEGGLSVLRSLPEVVNVEIDGTNSPSRNEAPRGNRTY